MSNFALIHTTRNREHVKMKMLVGGLMDSYTFSMVELYRKCFFGGFLWDHFKLVAWLNDMEAVVLVGLIQTCSMVE